MHPHHTMGPAHKGVEGNEIADTYAKWAADSFPTRWTRATSGRLTLPIPHAKQRRIRRRAQMTGSDGTPRPKRDTPPPRVVKSEREGKGVASHFFQLLSGHAAIGPYLANTTKTYGPTDVGATAANDSRATTYSSSAGPGRPK